MKKVYFYDDDIFNWSIRPDEWSKAPFKNQEEKQEADEKIKFIRIPGGHLEESGSVAQKYLDELEAHTDAYNKHAGREALQRGWYFPNSGVKTSHLDELMRDINTNKVSAIVFDFDKTLQLFEGALVGGVRKV